MKKLFLILGFMTAIIALILAVTPLFNMVFIPAIAALVFGLLLIMTSKDKQRFKKPIQLIFLMTIIALVFTMYKLVFSTSTVGDTEQLEQKVEQLEEESIEELDGLEIDDMDYE